MRSMKTVLLMIVTLSMCGCQTVRDVTREYRQVYAFVDTASVIQEFVRAKALAEWDNPTVEIYDTALYAVASRDVDDYLLSKMRLASREDSVELELVRGRTKAAVSSRERVSIPLTPPNPVADTSHFVVFLSPDIYGLIVAELLPVYPKCHPRCDPRHYGTISTFSQGLRMSFYFDEKGNLDSSASYLVNR
jgi:uncharacterized protein YceK